MGKYERMSKELDKIVSALKNLGYKMVEEDETSLTFEVPRGRLVIDYSYPSDVEIDPPGIWVDVYEYTFDLNE